MTVEILNIGKGGSRSIGLILIKTIKVLPPGLRPKALTSNY